VEAQLISSYAIGGYFSGSGMAICGRTVSTVGVSEGEAETAGPELWGTGAGVGAGEVEANGSVSAPHPEILAISTLVSETASMSIKIPPTNPSSYFTTPYRICGHRTQGFTQL